MRRARIFPSWMYRPPEEIIERLLEIGSGTTTRQAYERVKRDRYYTLARRVRVREAMRGRR